MVGRCAGKVEAPTGTARGLGTHHQKGGETMKKNWNCYPVPSEGIGDRKAKGRR